LKTRLKGSISHILLLIVFVSIFSSCYKRDFDKLKLANASPGFLYPLIDAELTMKDIIDPSKKQLNITEDVDGFYTFIYYQDLIEKPITDLLQIEDISTAQSVSLTGTEVSALPGSATVTHTFSKSLSLDVTNGEELKQITVKSGSLPFSISSTFRHNVQVSVTFPYIKKNNIPLTKTINLNYSGTVPMVSSNSIDLAGYIIDCSEGNTKVNTISYTGTVMVTYISGNSINTTQKVDFTTGIMDVEYSYIEGYIGQYVLNIPQDSVAIDIFDNAFLGSIFFTDPKVRTIITSSVGAPSTVKLNKLVTKSNITGTTDITGTIINTDIPINYPSISQVGQEETTTIQLDKTNSNVQTVFNPAPNKVIYQMSAVVNPAGPTANFVTDNSKIKIRGEVEIPMEGKISQLILKDSINGMTFPDLVISGKQVVITGATFNLSMQNGFPMNTNVQMYFIDDTNVIVDSLFESPHLIMSAAVDAMGKVTTPTEVIIKEVFDQERYSRITSSTKAVIYAYFSTVNNGSVPVRIYSSYKFKSKVGLDVHANVTF
jgi:hypothetical protein